MVKNVLPGCGSKTSASILQKLRLVEQKEILILCQFLLNGLACCSSYWTVMELPEDMLHRIKIVKLGESGRTVGGVIVLAEQFRSVVGLEPA